MSSIEEKSEQIGHLTVFAVVFAAGTKLVVTVELDVAAVAVGLVVADERVPIEILLPLIMSMVRSEFSFPTTANNLFSNFDIFSFGLIGT